MIKPHPPRLRMKRRKTVSVTPAMGASTVAGAISMPPIDTPAGTGFSGAAWRARVPAPHEPLPTELSQALRTGLFYLAVQTKAPAAKRGLNYKVYPWQKLVLCCPGLRGLILSILAAEALHASGRIHQLLLAGKERMAG